jgi:hypothetical protein
LHPVSEEQPLPLVFDHDHPDILLAVRRPRTPTLSGPAWMFVRVWKR